MTLKEISERIDQHLKRHESDAAWNRSGKSNSHFYYAGSRASGNRVFCTYKSYQGEGSLTKAQASAYLAKLDDGFRGRHYEALRETA